MIGDALNGIAKACSPQFYYGSDPNWSGTLATQIQSWKHKREAVKNMYPDYTAEMVQEFDLSSSVDVLLEDAYGKADSLNRDKKTDKRQSMHQTKS